MMGVARLEGGSQPSGCCPQESSGIAIFAHTRTRKGVAKGQDYDYAVQRTLKKDGEDIPYKPFDHGPGRPHPL